jgi:hypothetical protein
MSENMNSVKKYAGALLDISEKAGVKINAEKNKSIS